MSTGAGRQIVRQKLFNSKGMRIFTKYEKEYKHEFPRFSERLALDILGEMRRDPDPGESQQEFAREMGSEELALERSRVEGVRAGLDDEHTMRDRTARILDSNFIKMTFPVFYALYDAAADLDGRNDRTLRTAMVDGHLAAIALSEPMDRIVDRDEDLEYLDDYKLLNPYILKVARARISAGGEDVLAEFEEGFRDAMAGQHLDVKMKLNPTRITERDMAESYKKYRAVMGTAGRNMALARNPLGEIFYVGMARAAETVGCGNEIEDSIRDGAIKIPSWPLYYSLLMGDVRKGFDLTVTKSQIYLQEARVASEMLPDNFAYREFFDLLLLTVEHYVQFRHRQLQKADLWRRFEEGLPS